MHRTAFGAGEHAKSTKVSLCLSPASGASVVVFVLRLVLPMVYMFQPKAIELRNVVIIKSIINLPSIFTAA